MKNLFFSSLLSSIILGSSCVGGEIAEQIDPSIQITEDSVTIINYIEDLGFSNIDSALASGVHYVILDSGDMEPIDESDIVTFDYIGKLLNDTIFDTSIEEVADSIRTSVEANITEGDTLDVEFALLNTFNEDRNYEPFEDVYSATGWTIRGDYINGFSDGLSASFRHLRVGGSVLIVIPSAEAYGSSGSGFLIEPNTVIAFELFPIAVIKQ